MGINNLYILQHPEPNRSARRAQEMLAEKRIVEHRNGEHPYGFKRRDCPLCLSGKDEVVGW